MPSEPAQTMTNQHRNWTIHGTAQSGGGRYHKVTVRGEGVVNGDLECTQLKVMGTMQIAGAATIASVRVMGTLTIDGALRGEKCSILGECTVQGDCSAEILRVKGTCEIAGMVNADQVNIEFFGPSKIREIGCETANLRPRKHWFKHNNCICNVDTIEGDDLHLEQVKARVIRGNRIEIGPNCTVERVEYGSSLSVHPTAHVKDRIHT